jgi:hypothetical protein
MKTVLKFSLVLFLCTAILFSSTGITVFKMVCGSSGKELLSLEQFEDCCEGEEQDKTLLDEKCCDFSAQTFKLSTLHKTEFKLVFSELFTSLNFYQYLPEVQFSANKISLATDSSPPKSGRTILNFISLLLI